MNWLAQFSPYRATGVYSQLHQPQRQPHFTGKGSVDVFELRFGVTPEPPWQERWDDAFQTAEKLFDMGDLDTLSQASVHYEDAYRIAKDNGASNTMLFESARAFAVCLDGLEQFQNAQTYFNRAFQVIPKKPPNYWMLGQWYLDVAQHYEAKRNSVLAKFEDAHDDSDCSGDLGDMAQKALISYTKSWRSLQQVPKSERDASWQQKWARANRGMGVYTKLKIDEEDPYELNELLYDKAQQHLETALRHFVQSDNRYLIAGTSFDLAELHTWRIQDQNEGEFQGAPGALGTYTARSYLDDAINTLHTIFRPQDPRCESLLEAMGHVATAQNWLESERETLDDMLAQSGDALLEQDALPEAVQVVDAEELSGGKRKKKKPTPFEKLTRRAEDTLWQQEDPEAAIGLFLKALGMLKRQDPTQLNPKQYHDALRSLAKAYVEQGNYDQAAGYYDQAIDYYRSLGNETFEAMGLAEDSSGYSFYVQLADLNLELADFYSTWHTEEQTHGSSDEAVGTYGEVPPLLLKSRERYKKAEELLDLVPESGYWENWFEVSVGVYDQWGDLEMRLEDYDTADLLFNKAFEHHVLLGKWFNQNLLNGDHQRALTQLREHQHVQQTWPRNRLPFAKPFELEDETTGIHLDTEYQFGLARLEYCKAWAATGKVVADHDDMFDADHHDAGYAQDCLDDAFDYLEPVLAVTKDEEIYRLLENMEELAIKQGRTDKHDEIHEFKSTHFGWQDYDDFDGEDDGGPAEVFN